MRVFAIFTSFGYRDNVPSLSIYKTETNLLEPVLINRQKRT
jgi:hypothetical protein